MVEAERFGGDFCAMRSVEVCGGVLVCVFENGDEARLKVSGLRPPGYENPRWEEVSLDPGGWTITVPADPSYKIPWDVIRRRTHAGFAKHLDARDKAFNAYEEKERS